jgi:hypothetical protein
LAMRTGPRCASAVTGQSTTAANATGARPAGRRACPRIERTETETRRRSEETMGDGGSPHPVDRRTAQKLRGSGGKNETVGRAVSQKKQPKPNQGLIVLTLSPSRAGLGKGLRSTTRRDGKNASFGGSGLPGRESGGNYEQPAVWCLTRRQVHPPYTVLRDPSSHTLCRVRPYPSKTRRTHQYCPHGYPYGYPHAHLIGNSVVCPSRGSYKHPLPQLGTHMGTAYYAGMGDYAQ